MDKFDELQQDWGKITTEEPISLESGSLLFANLKKRQKKIVFTNLVLSILFALVFIVLGLVWSTSSHREPLFYGSLIALFILLSLSLVLFWYQVLFWKTPDFSTDFLSFSTRVIRKLKFSMWLTAIYLPLYAVCLGLIFTAYFQIVLAEKDLQTKIIVHAITYTWILFITLWGWWKKRHKNLKEITPLIDELENMQHAVRGQ